MIELHALGTFGLRRDGVDVGAILDQPKRFALLAYLAVSSPRGPHQREKLLALFWPDMDAASARHALRQSLHVLRQALGRDAIVTRGSELVGVSPLVWSDVAAFDNAVAAGNDNDAAAHYRGELLPGLFVAGCQDFEHWLETERTRLARSAADVFWRLADSCLNAHDAARAAEYAARAAMLHPDDEAVLRRALRVLYQGGESGRALQMYDSFARRMQQEYELPISAETEALIGAIRAHDSTAGSTLTLPAPLASRPEATIVTPRTLVDPQLRAPLRRRWLRAAVVVALALLFLWFPKPATERSATADDAHRTIAVLPFAMASSGPAHGWLGAGIADLLTTRFPGDIGPRAVDARATFAAWYQAGFSADALPVDSAAALAARLGADLVLFGRAAVTLDSLTIHATVLEVSTRTVRTVAHATGVLGDLSGVVDAIAARALGNAAGEEGNRLALLTTTSHEALLAYLAGRRGVRSGKYDLAVREYDRALQLDSTFALAAIELIDAMGWTHEPPGVAVRARRAISLGYERLSARDRAHVHAYYGTVIPLPPAILLSRAEIAQHRERYVQLAPDRPEAWYVLGDFLFHFGALMALPDARERATSAFKRAVELDPQLAGAAEHLLQLAVQARDSARVRTYLELYLEHNAHANDADYVRWIAAHVCGDSTAVARLRSRWNDLSDLVLVRILQSAQEDGIGLDDAQRAADALWLRHRTKGLLVPQLAALHTWALNTGKRREAKQIMDELLRLDPASANGPNNRIVEALYWDGDPAVAQIEAHRFKSALADPATANRPALSLTARCAVAQWQLARGDTAGVLRLVNEIAQLATGARTGRERFDFCLAATRALLESRQRAPDPYYVELTRLDSLVGHWPPVERYAPVLAARLFRASGNPAAARAAASRRHYGGTQYYLAPLLLEEARAAAAANHASARSLYRHYLLLRADADSELWPQRDSARMELERLERRVGAPRGRQ